MSDVQIYVSNSDVCDQKLAYHDNRSIVIEQEMAISTPNACCRVCFWILMPNRWQVLSFIESRNWFKRKRCVIVKKSIYAMCIEPFPAFMKLPFLEVFDSLFQTMRSNQVQAVPVRVRAQSAQNEAEDRSMRAANEAEDKANRAFNEAQDKALLAANRSEDEASCTANRVEDDINRAVNEKADDSANASNQGT